MASSAASADQEKLTNFVEKNGIHTFKIGAVDLDGLWRGKRVSAEHFLNSVHSDGTFFCNILFGWDMQDEPIPDLAYTGWHTGFPDINLRPDISTLAAVPWELGTASVICDVFELDGSPLDISPRTVLKSTVARAESTSCLVTHRRPGDRAGADPGCTGGTHREGRVAQPRPGPRARRRPHLLRAHRHQR